MLAVDSVDGISSVSTWKNVADEMNQTAKPRRIQIDAALNNRLTALAERDGVSVDDLVTKTLSRHADERERVMDDLRQDEERWQRYLATGHAVPFESVRRKLRAMVAKAANRSNTW
ncbi:MAG: hypothetical protein AAGG65_06595 [Pseudomonadota bacterium]